MARTISTRLAVDGEAQYRQAVAACNAELKTMRSSLALVESEFRGNANSMEALTAKGSALDAMYEKQKEKVSELDAALRNAQRAQEEYSSRISAAQGNIERCERALEGLRQSTGDTSKEQEALTKELDKYNAELAEAQAGHAAAGRGVQDWQRQLNNAKIELNGLSDKIEQNNRYLREAEESADSCARSIDQYGKEVKQAGESSEEFAAETQQSKQGIEQLAAALAAAGIAKTVKEIADELLACSDAAAGFEVSVAKLSTLVDTSIYSMDGIKAQLVELSNETGVAAGALAEAAYQARSAGVDAADVVDFVATATKTSAAGFTDAATAVDVLTTAINAYHMEGSQAEKVASMLVKTQDEGKTSVGELAQNMGRVIPVAATYNVSLGNLTAAYAQLTKSGTGTAIATTNLTAMFNELAKDGSEVAGVLQEQTGQSFAQLMASGKDLGGIMTILSDSVEGDATAFANLWSSTTAGQAALSLLNSGAEEFTRTLGIMESSSGAVERNFQTMADTTEFAQQRMTNAAENLKIAIGDQLNPALERLYDTGADAFTWATDFVEENPWVVSAIVGLTAALGALAIGAAGIAAASTIVSAFSAALTLLSANPIVLVTAAVVGLVAAVNTWRATLDDTDAATAEFVASLKETKAAYDDLMSSMGDQQASAASTAAALKDLLAVEDRSATQKRVLKDLVDKLNEAVPDLGLAYDEASDSINMTADAIDAMLSKEADQEAYNAQVDRLSQLYIEQAEISARLEEAQGTLNDAQSEGRQELSQYFDIATDYNSALDGSSGKTATLENNVRELTAAQEANAAEIAKLEEETEAYAQKQAEAAQAAGAMTSKMEGIIAGLEDLQAAYNESYDAAMDSITRQLGLFNKLDGEAKTSVNDLIDTLKGQVSYMETYSANIQRAMELGVDEGLIRKLSDGSEESAQILDAIVKGGQEKVAELNEQFAKVEEGKEKFSDTIAAMEADFDKKMDAIAKDLEQTVRDMDLHDEAYKAGANDIQGLIDGMESKRADLVATGISMAKDVQAAYLRESDQHSPSKKFEMAGRNDILGLIQGARGELPNLINAYAEAARVAQEAYDMGRLKYQAWERTDGQYVSEAERYAQKLAMLNAQQEDQQAVVNAAAAAYEAVVAQYGAASEESYSFQEALLQEKLALQDLLDEIKEVSDARASMAQQSFKELDSLFAAKSDAARLQYQLWERVDGQYASEAEKYAQKLAMLNGLLEDQQAVVNAAAAAYEEAAAQYGAASEESYNYQKALLQEKLAQQDLLDEIEQVSDAKASMARQTFFQQAQLAWESSALGKASSAANSAGYITPYEVAKMAGIGIVTADGFEAATQDAMSKMARHLPAQLETPRTSETLWRQMETISAATVNAISGIAQGMAPGTERIRLVTVDGKVLAEAAFDDFVNYGKANGTPIVNKQK